MTRKYISNKEIKALGLMTPTEIIDKIRNDTGYDVSVGFQVRVIEYRDNPLAPEKYAYSLSWTCIFSGKREKCIYYPNTYGNAIMSNQIIYAEDARYFRKIALRPTLAAICQQIFDAGFDCRNQFAARRVLSARDLGYWEEFIACALPSDWLIWARECTGHHIKIEMMEYYHDALNALRKI